MRLPQPYRPEAWVVAHRLSGLDQAIDWASVCQLARPWVQAVRDNPAPFWAMESLLKEYPISGAEGLALMRLAEALLRVPDAETAIALTADQLGRADFETAGDTTLARLSGAAIALSKKFLPEGEAPAGIFAKLGARSVVAATLRAVQLLGRQFVMGQTIAEAMHEAALARAKITRSDSLAPAGGAKETSALRFSYDMLGEGARTSADALRYLASYTQALQAIAATAQPRAPCEAQDGISVKLSALHPRFEEAQRPRVMTELLPRLIGLCELAARANINLTIDAEEVERLELSLAVFDALVGAVVERMPEWLAGSGRTSWSGLGLAMQAYQTRALELVDHVAHLARRHGIRLMCRLVKGAYWDAEIKRAQELGLTHYPVFTHKHHTDVSYLACARALLAVPDAIYPQFATHNAATIAAIVQMAARSGARFELQRLHGMGEGIYREVLNNPLIHCRVYAPVGAHKDLLAYLVRRLLENGANSSFVHQLADESVSMDALLMSPLRLDPAPSLPLPGDLFGAPAGGRQNSAGLDLTVLTQREPLLAAYGSLVVEPVLQATPADIAAALQRAQDSFPAWRATPVAERAAMLRRAADDLQDQLPRFCALLVHEAFKTWGDAVAEVREAIDFLRYYADEAQRIMQPLSMPAATVVSAGRLVAAPGLTGETNILSLSGRGAWVCISPWNFPLAIFVGQLAAALATGNTVLAKPAEQTPAVALAATRLLQGAGLPEGVLQLLNGPGNTVGAALVGSPGVAGVVFTGSTEVARTINRTLAAKEGSIAPLIAETGGINAMLVDSSALPEQVVDAVMQSAFRSAGQRCSALRLLCLHEDIADGVIEMIRGAASELRLGEPAELATDLGPVIDAEAHEGISRHIQRLSTQAKLLFGGAAPNATGRLAHLIAPHAFEVRRIASVQHEIFGPVLQVVRWRGDPRVVVDEINALGYGLTIGVHTRIDSRAQSLARAAHVGNVYINRNQIGAVVGVQPFGGEGLSGTGPKAGGPHYLYRFCAEQTVTVNTTAAGGNVQLLA